MHPEAYEHCRRFVAQYLVNPRYLVNHDNLVVLDIGAQAVGEEPNCLRPLFSTGYVGFDIAEGANVDVVMEPYYIPVPDYSADIVVSSSCFEHVAFFWKLFDEMVRVLAVGGFLWLDVPSAGPVHWGADYWRFLPDCWAALRDWNGHVELVEQSLGGSETWVDNVAVFRKTQ